MTPPDMYMRFLHANLLYRMTEAECGEFMAEVMDTAGAITDDQMVEHETIKRLLTLQGVRKA